MHCHILSYLLLLGQTLCASVGNFNKTNNTGTNEVPKLEAFEEDEVFELTPEIDQEFISQGGKRINNRTRATSDFAGCPAKIPTIANGKIVAGRIYGELGNDLPQLSCNGPSWTHYAETKTTAGEGEAQFFHSVIINPGCQLYAFPSINFIGAAKGFYGPAIMPNPPIEEPVGSCPRGPCVASFLWTCTQIYPSCTPSDKWQSVTELDNSDSSVPVKFTYEKIVGTEYSQSLTESMSVSATVSAEISAEFWGVTATLGVSLTTGYDWSQTDSHTKSESKTYTVEIIVPAGAKLLIQEAMGTCGGSTIHTQMFKVIDSINGKMIRAYNEKMANIIVP